MPSSSLIRSDIETLRHAVGLHRHGNLEDAAAIYSILIESNPKNFRALSLLGTIHAQRGDYANAIPLFDAAISSNPSHAEAYYNRGLTQQLLGHYENALVDYEKATKADPNYAEAYWHRSLVSLSLGRYKEGWSLFEWRWKREGHPPFQPFQKPLALSKQELIGTTILLHTEQGYGDTLQFCRYIPLLANDTRVIFECPSSLSALMEYNFPNVEVITIANDGRINKEPPSCDYHINMMSLPMIFGTTLDNIPFNTSAYLKAPPEYTTKWSTLLQPFTAHISKATLIGLCWAGGKRDNPDLASVDARRSLHFDQIKTFLNIPNCQFVSLQIGPPASERDDDRVVDLSSYVKDWADTAALISLLDIVVTVDTSVCHIAAAMGKETLLLNRYDTCWRWLLERADSPWYSTLLQFRQKQAGNWEDVINEAKNYLIEHTA